MNNFIYFFMAIGLSMDAFSLALAYGTTKITFKKKLILSVTVGLFHLIMPNLGAFIGNELLLNYISKTNYLVGIIFFIIAIEMYISKKDEKKVIISNLLSIILFAFTVSIDSFSVGIALSFTTKNIKLASFIFFIVSLTFTFIGINLGNKLSKKYEEKSENIGIIIILLLSIKYLFF